MQQPGAIGYVIINYDGKFPTEYFYTLLLSYEAGALTKFEYRYPSQILPWG